MGPIAVLFWDACPLNLPEILTEAHLVMRSDQVMKSSGALPTSWWILSMALWIFHASHMTQQIVEQMIND